MKRHILLITLLAAAAGIGGASIAAALAFQQGRASVELPPASRYRSIQSAEELDALVREAEKAPLLIDLRDRKDFEESHIAGFLNISNEGEDPVLDRWIEPHSRNRQLVLICYSGNRSARAFEKLVVMGFTNIADFTPGYAAYQTQKGADWKPASGSCNCPE
jgi:rhodanese-related sulfurtransferase